MEQNWNTTAFNEAASADNSGTAISVSVNSTAATVSVSTTGLQNLCCSARQCEIEDTMKLADSKKTMKMYENSLKNLHQFLLDNGKEGLLDGSTQKLARRPDVPELLEFLQMKRSHKPDIRVGTLKSVKSAINKYISVFSNEDVPPYSKKEEQLIARYFKGCKNQAAADIVLGLRTLEEGKRALSLQEYKRLALVTLSGEDSVKLGRHHAELHLALLLSHNMLSRLETTTEYHTHHLDWEGDALLIGVAKSKRNYSEVAQYYRVYANPFSPEVCPVLALAILCCSNPSILLQYKSLFHGTPAEARNTISKQFLHLVKSEGLDNVGFHSIRKRGITEGTTGTSEIAPLVATLIRARWKTEVFFLSDCSLLKY